MIDLKLPEDAIPSLSFENHLALDAFLKSFLEGEPPSLAVSYGNTFRLKLLPRQVEWGIPVNNQ